MPPVFVAPNKKATHSGFSFCALQSYDAPKEYANKNPGISGFSGGEVRKVRFGYGKKHKFRTCLGTEK